MEIVKLDYILVTSTDRISRGRNNRQNMIFFPPHGEPLLVNGYARGDLAKILASQWNSTITSETKDPYVRYSEIIQRIYDSGFPSNLAINQHFTNGQKRSRRSLFSLIDTFNPILNMAGWQINLDYRPDLYAGFEPLPNFFR